MPQGTITTDETFSETVPTKESINKNIPAGSVLDTQTVLAKLREMAAKQCWCRQAEQMVAPLKLAFSEEGDWCCDSCRPWIGYNDSAGVTPRFPYLPDKGMPDTVSARKLAYVAHAAYLDGVLPGDLNDPSFESHGYWECRDGWTFRRNLLRWIAANAYVKGQK